MTLRLVTFHKVLQSVWERGRFTAALQNELAAVVQLFRQEISHDWQ